MCGVFHASQTSLQVFTENTSLVSSLKVNKCYNLKSTDTIEQYKSDFPCFILKIHF